MLVVFSPGTFVFLSHPSERRSVFGDDLFGIMRFGFGGEQKMMMVVMMMTAMKMVMILTITIT